MRRRTTARPPPRRPAPAGDRAAVLRSLRELQRLAHRLRRAARAPLVERVAQIVETECHLALWALGEVRGLTPEAEAATVSDRAAAGVRPAASRPPRRRRTGPRPPGGS